MRDAFSIGCHAGIVGGDDLAGVFADRCRNGFQRQGYIITGVDRVEVPGECIVFAIEVSQLVDCGDSQSRGHGGNHFDVVDRCVTWVAYSNRKVARAVDVPKRWTFHGDLKHGPKDLDGRTCRGLVARTIQMPRTTSAVYRCPVH